MCTVCATLCIHTSLLPYNRSNARCGGQTALRLVVTSTLQHQQCAVCGVRLACSSTAIFLSKYAVAIVSSNSAFASSRTYTRACMHVCVRVLIIWLVRTRSRRLGVGTNECMAERDGSRTLRVQMGGDNEKTYLGSVPQLCLGRSECSFALGSEHFGVAHKLHFLYNAHVCVYVCISV